MAEKEGKRTEGNKDLETGGRERGQNEEKGLR